MEQRDAQNRRQEEYLRVSLSFSSLLGKKRCVTIFSALFGETWELTWSTSVCRQKWKMLSLLDFISVFRCPWLYALQCDRRETAHNALSSSNWTCQVVLLVPIYCSKDQLHCYCENRTKWITWCASLQHNSSVINEDESISPPISLCSVTQWCICRTKGSSCVEDASPKTRQLHRDQSQLAQVKNFKRPVLLICACVWGWGSLHVVLSYCVLTMCS